MKFFVMTNIKNGDSGKYQMRQQTEDQEKRYEQLKALRPAELFMDKIKDEIENRTALQSHLVWQLKSFPNHTVYISDSKWPDGITGKISYPKVLRAMNITDEEMCRSFPLFGSVTRTIEYGPLDFCTLVGKRPISSILTVGLSIYLVPNRKKWFFF